MVNEPDFVYRVVWRAPDPHTHRPLPDWSMLGHYPSLEDARRVEARIRGLYGPTWPVAATAAPTLEEALQSGRERVQEAALHDRTVSEQAAVIAAKLAISVRDVGALAAAPAHHDPRTMPALETVVQKFALSSREQIGAQLARLGVLTETEGRYLDANA